MRSRPHGRPGARGCSGARTGAVDGHAVGVGAGPVARGRRRSCVTRATVAPLSPAERAERPRRPTLPKIKPVRIELPTIGVGAPIVPVTVGRDGALGVPNDPHVVGWWAGGGEALVLDGHVDTAAEGPGALFRLVDLAVGDTIGLAGADGAVRRFMVTEVRAYSKATLPSDVFRPAARLVIITCGGHFDRHTLQYVDNIVAYAEPVPVP